jgi:RNA polymerase sigma factor (sigma-70 family)
MRWNLPHPLICLKMNPSSELLEQCQTDNRKAHYELYRMCFSYLLSVCSRYYINADDRMSSLNMIFFKVIKNINQFRNKNSLVPFELWIRRIAINYIIDEFRKDRKYKKYIELQDVSVNDDLHPFDNSQADIEANEEIIEAIEMLPHMSRAVFNLYFIDGYKHDEIAGLLGISSGTSKVHLHRARKRLQEILESKKKTMSFKTILS